MESKTRQFPFFWILFVAPLGIAFTHLFFTIFPPSSLRDVVARLGFNQMRTFSLLVYNIGTGVVVLLLFILLRRRGLGLHALGLRGKLTTRGALNAFGACLFVIAIYPLIEGALAALGISMYWIAGIQAPMRSHTFLNAVYVTFGAAIFSPLTEDIVFRGYVFQMFQERFNALVAASFAIAVFAVIHLPFFGPGLTIYMIPWTAVSIYLFKRFDTLYVPMLYHALNNFFAYVLLPMML